MTQQTFYLGTQAYSGPSIATFAWTSWNDTAAAVTRDMTTTPVGAATSVAQAETSTSTFWDVLLGRWVSPPMIQNGTLPAQVTPAIAALSQSDAAASLNTLWSCKVIDSAGGTRATGSSLVLGADMATTPTAFGYNMTFPNDVACQVGDRIVIELGYRGDNGVATSYTGTLRYGGTLPELAVGDTGAAATSRVAHVTFETGALFEPLPTVPILRSADTAAPVLLGVDVAWGADITDPASWTWTDITADVLVADGAQIQLVHGRGDEAGDTQPATCDLLLSNPDGRYSLGPESPNYPNVRRNTPVRVRIRPDADPVALDAFVGFTNGWTPSWDPSGNHATVTLSAAGTLRRLLQRTAPVISSMRRAVLAQINEAGSTVTAYWPLEDGPGSSLLTNLVPGGLPAAISGEPRLGGSDAFLSSAPIVAMDEAIIRGAVPTDGNLTSAAQLRWMMDAGPNPSADVVLVRVATVGTITRWDLSWQTGGNIRVQAWDNSGAEVVDTNPQFNTGDSTRRWQLELSTSGGTITWTVLALEIGYNIGGFFSGTVSGTVSAISAVTVSPGADLTAGIGHIVVSKAIIGLFDQSEQLNAYIGELAHDRVTRLCAENKIPVQLVGVSAVKMGPQSQATLVELLRECETADQGLLFDGTHSGLTYICGAQRVNAAAALTLNAAAGQIVGSVDPVDNDQRNVNKVTASRFAGAGVVFADLDGPLGITAIGEYEDAVRVNVASDADVIDYAGWEVHKGTRRGYRYPFTRLALHHNPTLAPAWTDTMLGGRIDLTGIATVRTQFPTGTVRSLLEGYSQTIDAYAWDVALVLSSYESWRVGELVADTGDTNPEVLRLDTDGSTVASPASQGATSLSVATPTGPLWTTLADDLPMSVEIGGREITVTAISGASSPQTFTVNALPVAVASGAPVALWRPTVLGV
ncbi:MAG: hypothetical protein L0H84_04545 [Pseudonocardia sp.]|nr:hypothetical protein [Pseudonocardia sp.]